MADRNVTQTEPTRQSFYETPARIDLMTRALRVLVSTTHFHEGGCICDECLKAIVAEGENLKALQRRFIGVS